MSSVVQASPSQLPAENLYVNDGPLETNDIAFLKPSRPDEPVEDLRRKYEEDGYLFVKGVLPREDVLKAREDYFKWLAPTGVLKPGTEPVEGIFDSNKDKSDYPGIGAGAVSNDGNNGTADDFVNLALEAHTQKWYTDFCQHPALHDFVAKFSGWADNTLGVKRTLLRNNTPGNQAIGVHYDQIFMRYGEPTAVTAWVPMGDVSINGGGLIYLENGHALGQKMEQDFTAKAKASGMSDEEAKNAFNSNMLSTGFLDSAVREFSRRYNTRWLLAEYEAGDVVLHTPYMIHASTINHDLNDSIRVGTDLRYVDKTSQWDTRWDTHYRLGDGI